MIKLEVLQDESFTLGRFNEIKNLQRKKQDVEGKLNAGDVFECEKDLADYLLGDNKYKKAFVKIIEVIPDIPSKIEGSIKEETEKKKTTRKRTSKK